jgi:hypothetical protein
VTIFVSPSTDFTDRLLTDHEETFMVSSWIVHGREIDYPLSADE